MLLKPRVTDPRTQGKLPVVPVHVLGSFQIDCVSIKQHLVFIAGERNMGDAAAARGLGKVPIAGAYSLVVRIEQFQPDSWSRVQMKVQNIRGTVLFCSVFKPRFYPQDLHTATKFLWLPPVTMRINTARHVRVQGTGLQLVWQLLPKRQQFVFELCQTIQYRGAVHLRNTRRTLVRFARGIVERRWLNGGIAPQPAVARLPASCAHQRATRDQRQHCGQQGTMALMDAGKRSGHKWPVRVKFGQ